LREIYSFYGIGGVIIPFIGIKLIGCIIVIYLKLNEENIVSGSTLASDIAVFSRNLYVEYSRDYYNWPHLIHGNGEIVAINGKLTITH